MVLRPSAPPQKYQEDKILREVAEYIRTTYQGHYVNKDGVQVLDLIFAAGHGKSYCIANCLKYFGRLGKKEGFNRKDVLKAIHYAILLLHLDAKEGESK